MKPSTEEENEATSWKQWRIKTNLGTLVSIAIAIGVIFWQAQSIKSQIDSNSDGMHELAVAIEEFTHTTALAQQLDTITNQIDHRLSQIEGTDTAYVLGDIQTNIARISDLDIDIQDLEWKLDELEYRFNEDTRMDAIFQELDGLWLRIEQMQGGITEEWEVNDLSDRIVALETLMWNQGDSSWEIDELEKRLVALETTIWNQGDNSYELDELTRRINELEWSRDSAIARWEVDDLNWQINQLWEYLYNNY